MPGRIEIPQLESFLENLQMLANAYRDEGKYVMAGAQYRRATAILERVGPWERKQSRLAKILEDQAAMLRKMRCGSVAAVVEQYARAVGGNSIVIDWNATCTVRHLSSRTVPMVVGPSQEKTAVAVRSFVIWAEELSKKRRYAAAEKLYQRALTLVERSLGAFHPMMGEVLESYAELLVKMDRRAEGIVMKSRAEVVWKTYIRRHCRTHRDTHLIPAWQEREGSD